MIERLGRRVAIALGHGDPEIEVGLSPPRLVPVVEFVALGDDCVLVGRVRMTGDRMTDMLNDQDEYRLEDVTAEGLLDGRAAQAQEVLVPRSELFVVQAVGPRGDATRRHRTRPYPVAISLGPHLVRGNLHAMPGLDPVAALRGRRPMVPITDAWIDHLSGGTRELRPFGTVVINRERMDWIVETFEEAPRWFDVIEMPAET